jgi:hypothetical protein
MQKKPNIEIIKQSLEEVLYLIPTLEYRGNKYLIYQNGQEINLNYLKPTLEEMYNIKYSVQKDKKTLKTVGLITSLKKQETIIIEGLDKDLYYILILQINNYFNKTNSK